MAMIPRDDSLSGTLSAAVQRYIPYEFSDYYDDLRQAQRAARWLESTAKEVKRWRKSKKRMREEAKKKPSKKARISKFIPSYTTGMYHGKFKKRRMSRKKLRRVTRNPMKTRGMELVTEHGQVASDANLAGFAHGPAVAHMFYAVSGALWRKLWETAGYDICAWNIVPHITADKYTVSYSYRRVFDDTGVITRSVAFVVGDAHINIVDKLRQDFADALGISDNQFILESMTLVPVGTNNVVNAHLCCRNIRMDISQSSVLILQNRTAGAAATDDLITDVTNNPLTGRQFICRGNSLVPRGFNTSGVSAENSLLLEPFNGYEAVTSVGGQAGIQTKVPGPSFFQRVISTSRTRLDPGALKKSKMYFRKVLPLYKIFSYLSEYQRRATSGTVNSQKGYTALGQMKVYIFEKLCDTRAGSQNVQLGMEVNVITGARVVAAPRSYTRRHVDLTVAT